MKLLILTQKVNRDDPILGFFCRWITEFSKHFESIKVIALEVESNTLSTLPNNVKVFSLGKDKKIHTGLGKINYILRFYKYIWSLRDEYDAVFVHMNPIYVVLGGFIWKFLDKKIFLWYTHRKVDLKLRLAEKLADNIFTASSYSFKIQSKKVVVTGHGVSLENFANLIKTKIFGEEPLRIICVGRISKIKNLDILIRTAKFLKEKWNKNFFIDIIGDTINNNDIKYKEYLLSLIDKYLLHDTVFFYGNILNANISTEFARSDLSVNLSPAGGLDKSVLESMAAEVIVLSSNRAFEDYFGDYAKQLIFEENNADDLAQKIIDIFNLNSQDVMKLNGYLHRRVIDKCDMTELIGKISEKIWKQNK